MAVPFRHIHQPYRQVANLRSACEKDALPHIKIVGIPLICTVLRERRDDGGVKAAAISIEESSVPRQLFRDSESSASVSHDIVISDEFVAPCDMSSSLELNSMGPRVATLGDMLPLWLVRAARSIPESCIRDERRVILQTNLANQPASSYFNCSMDDEVLSDGPQPAAPNVCSAPIHDSAALGADCVTTPAGSRSSSVQTVGSVAEHADFDADDRDSDEHIGENGQTSGQIPVLLAVRTATIPQPSKPHIGTPNLTFAPIISSLQSALNRGSKDVNTSSLSQAEVWISPLHPFRTGATQESVSLSAPLDNPHFHLETAINVTHARVTFDLPDASAQEPANKDKSGRASQKRQRHGPPKPELPHFAPKRRTRHSMLDEKLAAAVVNQEPSALGRTRAGSQRARMIAAAARAAPLPLQRTSQAPASALAVNKRRSSSSSSCETSSSSGRGASEEL